MLKSRNYNAFIWHASFLALTSTFTDINTVISSLIMNVGGNSFHIGLLTAIMIGIPPLSKIIFAAFITSKPAKKSYLLAGINARVLALLVIGILLATVNTESENSFSIIIMLVFPLMFIFAIAGSLAGISYADILGKSLDKKEKRHFFVVRQYFQSFGILISALIARQIMSHMTEPYNYVVLFISASIMLFIASGGFWAIKEPIKENYSGKKYTILELLKTVPSIIKSDRNLKYFILLKNISGVGMMIFPFYIALAKERFGLSGQEIGNYLFFQIAGAVISVKLWAIINKRFGYKHILALCLLMSTGLPFLALYLGNLTPAWYTIIFFFSGFAASARGMSIEPVFISISTDENRAMYAGVVGVSLIITALIPILGGFLIHNFGFTSVFVAASFILLSGLPVLKNIRIKV